MKTLIISLKLLFITYLLNAQIVIPVDPKVIVETAQDGQTAIYGYSGNLGQIVLPPDDPASIGVKGIGFTGVFGQALAEFGYGLHGKTAKENASGVYGEATGDNSEGVVGEGTGSGARGVYGKGIGNFAYGVHGVGQGTNARGVFGIISNGSTGHSGYFFGGTGVYINNYLGVRNDDPDYPIHVGSAGNTGNGNGAHVTIGGTWTNGSSLAFKENFQPIDKSQLLDKLAALNIQRWEYKNSAEGQHIGPIAEEFYRAFGLGDDSRYISTVDADGIALVAIQALYEKLAEQQKIITHLQNWIENN